MLRHCLEWNQLWKKLSIIENKWWPCTKKIHQYLICNFKSFLSSMKAWTFPKYAARTWWHTHHHLPDYCPVYSMTTSGFVCEKTGKMSFFWLCKPQNNRSHYKVDRNTQRTTEHTLLWVKSPLTRADLWLCGAQALCDFVTQHLWTHIQEALEGWAWNS